MSSGDEERLILGASENDEREQEAQAEVAEKTHAVANIAASFKLRSALISAAVESVDKDAITKPAPNEVAAEALKEIPADLEVDYHTTDLPKLYERYNTDGTNGLSTEVAKKRLASDGPNTLVRIIFFLLVIFFNCN